MSITLDKQQAVKENIEQAIWSVFENQNYAASTTLIGSASSVLKDLLSDGSFRKTTSNLFPEISERKIYEELDKIWNFCKHAKKKSEKKILLEEEDTLISILLVIRDYRTLYANTTLLMGSYELWFCAKNQSFFECFPDEKRVVIVQEFGELYKEELLSVQIKKGWMVIKKHIEKRSLPAG